MGLKHISIAMLCAALAVWSGMAAADEYRPDEFLSLDLSRAVLSPKPLGPPAEFAPMPVEAKADGGGETALARVEQKAQPRVALHKTRVTRVAHLRAEKPRIVARTKLARHHGNPLDAQAFDARIQVWPCKSGGICNWRR
jgi:hypothetical protein